EVTDLCGPALINCLRNQVNGLSMLLIIFMRPETDGKQVIKRADILMSLRWQNAGDFIQGGIERRLDLGSGQGLEKFPAKSQCHKFRGRKSKGRNIAKSFDQAPARLAVVTFSDERKTNRF